MNIKSTEKKNRLINFAIPVGILTLLLGCTGTEDGEQAREDATPVEQESSDILGAQAQSQDNMVTVQSRIPEDGIQSQVEAVYRNSSGAVVNITSRIDSGLGSGLSQRGTGSGFLWDGEGHIVTNYHVIGESDLILISFGGEEMYRAEIIGSDPFSDLAVLRVQQNELPQPLALNGSDNLSVGQFVIALGNPYGLEKTMTFGVISALGRVVPSGGGTIISEAIQTDAPINPGSSGGPLLDLTGNVIGLNTMILSPSGASAGIGFAISTNTLGRIVPQLIEEGQVSHPWLGVSEHLTLTPGWAQILRELDVPAATESGVMVGEVYDGSPAEEAGLRGGRRFLQFMDIRIPVGGDVLVEIDGNPINRFEDLVLYLEAQTSIGDSVEITFYRGNEKMSRTVSVSERPRELYVQKMAQRQESTTLFGN